MTNPRLSPSGPIISDAVGITRIEGVNGISVTAPEGPVVTVSGLYPPILVPLSAAVISAPGTLASFIPYTGDYLYSVNFFVGLRNGPAPFAGAPMAVLFVIEPSTQAIGQSPEFTADASNIDGRFFHVTGQFRLVGDGVTPVTIVFDVTPFSIDPAPEVLEVATSGGVANVVMIVPLQRFVL